MQKPDPTYLIPWIPFPVRPVCWMRTWWSSYIPLCFGPSVLRIVRSLGNTFQPGLKIFREFRNPQKLVWTNWFPTSLQKTFTMETSLRFSSELQLSTWPGLLRFLMFSSFRGNPILQGFIRFIHNILGQGVLWRQEYQGFIRGSKVFCAPRIPNPEQIGSAWLQELNGIH